MKNITSECACCGGSPQDLAHILNKGRWASLRICLDNVFILCRNCHTKFHAKPKLFESWVGEDLIYSLMQRSGKGVSYEEIEENLKNNKDCFGKEITFNNYINKK